MHDPLGHSLPMEAELNWPDDKEIEDLVDDSATEHTTDAGDADIKIKIDDDTLASPENNDNEKETTTAAATATATAPATRTRTRTATRTSFTMDDYFFQHFVRSCRNVSEATSYLEIFNYSDSSFNTVEEHPLTMDEFDNFLHRRGAFAPPKLPPGVKLLNGCRIILQLKAKHPETFTPNVISFAASEYESMVRTLHLPFRAIEGTSAVGPFFWCAHDTEDEEESHLQIIMRKSDVRKKGKTRGWELMLGHNFASGLTTGYVKGTDSSDMEESIGHLKSCARQVAHPMLLPLIILSHDLSPKNDQKQRDARDWLRKLEHAVTLRNEIVEEEGYVKGLQIDLDQVNRDLVECHSQVLWKRPQAYQEIIKEMEKGMERFLERLPSERKAPTSPLTLRSKSSAWSLREAAERRSRSLAPPLERGMGRKEEWVDEYGWKEVEKCHRSMQSRLEFYRNKLKGIENYAHTTLERLQIQRSALYNIIAQKESKLNLQMAADQRRLAHAGKRDSTQMKTISLLGAIFLPATLLASVFSMVFFDVGSAGFTIAPTVWIYFVITIPVTMFIVLTWWVWERARERRYRKEDIDLEDQIDHMESKIMATMRKRTMSKVRTWTQAPEKVE